MLFLQKVDARKLEKAEAKLQQKLQKAKDVKSTPAAAPVLQTATASQVTSKKDSKLEAKGTNRTQDIRIENFDIAYGDRYVLLRTNYFVSAFKNKFDHWLGICHIAPKRIQKRYSNVS